MTFETTTPMPAVPSTAPGPLGAPADREVPEEFAAACRAAPWRLAGTARVTPVTVDTRSGVRLKCENLQLTGSFKLRGAFNALSGLGATDVVVGSSGNHGIAVAWAARRLGVTATVVMTRTSSSHKREAVRALGARVVLCDGGNEARGARVGEIAEETGAMVVSSFDHPLVVAGQASVGFEILDQVPDATTVVVPVGGGGLLAGVATAVALSGRPVRVLGVEPAGADDTARSLALGQRVSIAPPTTICDGVHAQTPGEFTFPLLQRFVEGIVVVDDAAVLHALRDLGAQGMTVEPTGALALAGARTLPSAGGVVAVVSGGNIRPEELRRLTGVTPARPVPMP
ncbi:pyridoxal-phosphate dependent enzyme [Streptomyces sp. NPDC000987]|uniref:pyridoxal-phosphate dependent enzyme n=1 Tax=Streptomyces sp. NPDC000987 TaxID=3154374 RepID=UPI00331A8D23